MASPTCATGSTCIPATSRSSAEPASGTIARSKPRREASARRRWIPTVARTSPVSPTSPKATRPAGVGRLRAAETTEMATARSVAGSTARAPPTVET